MIGRRHIYGSRIDVNTYGIVLRSYGLDGTLPAGHIYGPVFDQCYVLQYCAEGCGVLEIDGVPFPLHKGECIVSYPGQMRVEKTDPQSPWELMWLALDGSSMTTFLEEIGITPEQPVMNFWGGSQLPRSMQRLIETADEIGFQRKFLLGAKVLEFLDECLQVKKELTEQLSAGRARDTYVEQAMYYLDMHYGNHDITIEGLADYVGLNRSYLFEIFHEKTGVSPKEYLTRLRMQKACEHLKLPHATVTGVAHSLGYEASVFSKAFKRAIGITPTEYRSQMMETKES